jgi:signal transduction histidine kinase/ActR/RegA family two-component response regulator
MLDFADRAEPVSLQTTGAEVYSKFQNDPGALVIAVVDDDRRPVGLIERNGFFVKMGAEFGRALFAGRPVSFVMEPPRIQRADALVMDFMAGALSHDPAALLRGFVVVDEEGRYLAVGAALSLLEAGYHAAKARVEELAALSADLTRAEQEAKAASRAKSQFLATMSHEIRTPLNGVLAVAEIIDRKLTQTELRPYLRTIAESGNTLHRLLTDALDLSRVEAGAMTLDPAPTDIGAVVGEIVDLWQAQAELKGVALKVDHAPADIGVMVDAVRLKQVMNNLVGNALKFTDAGAVTLRCRLHPSHDGEAGLEIDVEDSGIGISAEQIERIFSPFAKADEHAGGAGLGLAICHRLITAMGGELFATSTPGHGSTFSVRLKLPAVCRVEPAAVALSPEDITGEDTLHVLVVDDNETNRFIAGTLLGMFGFTHSAATNGLDAVERAEAEAFDVILMDIKMPVMGGVAATRAIRTGQGINRATPIVALTANTDPADVDSYLAAGMAAVVGKPLQADRLLTAIVEAIEGGEAASPLNAVA